MITAAEATRQLYKNTLLFNGNVEEAVNHILTVIDTEIREEIHKGGNSVVVYFEHAHKTIRKIVAEKLTEELGYDVDIETAIENGVFWVTWERPEELKYLRANLIVVLDSYIEDCIKDGCYLDADFFHKLKLAYMSGKCIVDPSAVCGIREVK